MNTTTNPEGPEPVVLSEGAAEWITEVLDWADGVAVTAAYDLVHAFTIALQAHDETGKPVSVTIQIGGE